MNDFIVRFTNEDEFLEELRKDLEEYAVQIVETVRVSQVTDDFTVRVVASYKRNNELVKLSLKMGYIDDPMAVIKAKDKVDFLIDLIKTEDVDVKKGEFDIEE